MFGQVAAAQSAVAGTVALRGARRGDGDRRVRLRLGDRGEGAADPLGDDVGPAGGGMGAAFDGASMSPATIRARPARIAAATNLRDSIIFEPSGALSAPPLSGGIEAGLFTAFSRKAETCFVALRLFLRRRRKKQFGANRGSRGNRATGQISA